MMRLRWACKLGRAATLGISKADRTVLARLMESQIWHHLTRSMKGGFSKGTMASACLDAKHFSFSLYTTGAFQAATLVLELREWIWVGETMCGFIKRKCLGHQKFLLPTKPPLVFSDRSCGDLSSWHWQHGLGPDVGLRLLTPEISFLDFDLMLWAHAPPTSLDWCGFFNSVVVMLPFNLISDDSEWWLFYILVVILMWLCKGGTTPMSAYATILTRNPPLL